MLTIWPSSTHDTRVLIHDMSVVMFDSSISKFCLGLSHLEMFLTWYFPYTATPAVDRIDRIIRVATPGVTTQSKILLQVRYFLSHKERSVYAFDIFHLLPELMWHAPVKAAVVLYDVMNNQLILWSNKRTLRMKRTEASNAWPWHFGSWRPTYSRSSADGVA